MSTPTLNSPLTAPEDRVPFQQKLAYGAAGAVDIWRVWILVSIAYPLFNMELGLAPTCLVVSV
jgi:GPH family glycoside/pentoside/hexuronide:cation symporter